MADLLQILGVSKRFVKPMSLAERIGTMVGGDASRQTVHAVTGVDLNIPKGEVLGLVGESGCGKSTLGRIMAGIYSPSEGQVVFDGASGPATGSAHRQADNPGANGSSGPLLQPQPAHAGGRHHQ